MTEIKKKTEINQIQFWHFHNYFMFVVILNKNIYICSRGIAHVIKGITFRNKRAYSSCKMDRVEQKEN